jgi:hypothetical protein
VLYRVGRFDHGAASAAAMTAPPLPANAPFHAIADDELVARTAVEPHFVDRPGMPWPPLEGHYHYEVHGVDLLGTVGAHAVRADIRHHDDLAPMAPRARASDVTSLTLDATAASAQVRLRIDWDALEDFNTPDAVDFRVAASWISQLAIPIHVESVSDAGALHCDLTVANLAAAADALAGARLSVPGSEYPIVSHGTGTHATMRIRKIGARMPGVGVHGVVLTIGASTARTRVARMARRPAAPATVGSVYSSAPLVVGLSQAAGVALATDTSARIYLHLLRATFDAEFDSAAGRWTISEPPAETPARTAWDQWMTQPGRDTLLTGSPALVYPLHDLTAHVPVPAGYAAGLLTLYVTAADGTPYVASPAHAVADASLAGLRGNESGAMDVVIPVRSTAPPTAPSVGEWDPNTRLWARSASVYVENASYDLAWPGANGVRRYEVWRAIEGAIQGATPATSDAELRALAANQPGAFALRSDQIFAAAFQDLIPGRAPTRALYQIRSVGINGERSAPSAVIGPIHVPDIRQPPRPNLVRAVAVTPEEADRTIAVEWTQGADLGDVRFEIYARPAGTPEGIFELAGTVARNSAAGPGASFRFLHRDRPPGKPFEYQVVAVREALDPIDPAAVQRRDIASLPSAPRIGAAISSNPLAAPVSLAGSFDTAAGRVNLTWSVRDFYERIEVRRKSPERYAFEVIESVPGEQESFSEAAPQPGTYRYQLRAFGASRQATTQTDVQVVIP